MSRTLDLLLSGAKAPARHPHVAAALSEATITERAAGAIITLLDRVAFRAGPHAVDTAENAGGAGAGSDH